MLTFRFACAWLVVGLALVHVAADGHAQSLDDLKVLNQRINTLFNAGKFQEAIPLAQEYTKHVRERFGSEHAEYATAQYRLAFLHNQVGQTSEAEAAAKFSLLLREKLLDPNDLVIADTLILLSDIDRKLGRKVEREARIRRALSIRETSLGREHPLVADALANLAFLCDPPACTAETEWAWKRMVAIREKALGRENRLALLSRLGLAEYYRMMGKFSEAEPLYRQGIPEWERLFAADQFELGFWLHGLGEIARVQGRLDEARDLQLRSLAIREKNLRADDPALVATIRALGTIATAQSQYLEAAKWYERIAPLAAQNPDFSWAPFLLALSYHSAGRYRDAEPAYAHALETTAKVHGPEHPRVADVLNNLANLYSAQGRRLEAEPLYKRALGIRERLGREDADIATSLHNLADHYQYLGRYQEAQQMEKRALDIREKTLGPNHGEYARSLMVLAYIYGNLGRHEDAEPLVERAIGIYEKAPAEYQGSLAGALQGLASIRQLQGRHGEAEALVRRSIEIEKAAFGAEHANLVSSYNALANLLDEAGRPDEARTQLEKALAIAENSLGQDHPEALYSRVSLALRQAEGKPEMDIGPLVESARALAETKMGSMHPAFVPAFTRVGRTYMIRKEWLAAYQYLKRASEIAEQKERYVDHRTVLARAQVRGNEFTVPYSSAIRAAYRIPASSRHPGLADEVFRLSQIALQSAAAKALGQMAARFSSSSGPLADLVRERQDLVSQRMATERQLFLQKAGRQTAPDEVNTDLPAIEARLDAVDERLKREFPEYARLASPEPLTIAEVQELLRPDEVLVQFMEAPKVGKLASEVFVWAIGKRDSRWASAGLDGESVERLVRKLRCELDETPQAREASHCQKLPASDGSPSSFDVGAAHTLYRGLLEPFDDLIGGKHLLVVSSGVLASLPIHVLVTEASELSGEPNDPYRNVKWLIARQPNTVLPSVASLKALRRAAPSKASKPYIAFGNPLVDGDPAKMGESERAARARDRQRCLTSPAKVRVASVSKSTPVKPLARGGLADVAALRRLMPLPETTDELCAVAGSLGAEPREVRLGSAATESEAKVLSKSGELASYRIVHFATHGALSGEIEGNAEPGLILTPPATASEDDDGYLSASEIAALKLDADWVVLSACSTAGPGGANADALSGVARAFFYAGARSLLVSHWAVDSDATVELITKTFAALRDDLRITRAEALRRSMLALIERGGAFAHPRTWAPFILVGEGWASVTAAAGPKEVARGADGTWTIAVKGQSCDVPEASDKATYRMVVSGGSITGLKGRLRGSVSATGAAKWTIPTADGVPVRFQGTLGEKNAHGRVSRTDRSCEGTFTARRKLPKTDALSRLTEGTPRAERHLGKNSPKSGVELRGIGPDQ